MWCINWKVSAFVDVEDPVRMLTDTHVLEFGPECEVYKDHRATTDEIKHLCSGIPKSRACIFSTLVYLPFKKIIF